MSFGVASASLATALFVPDRFHSSPGEMIHGIHQAFFVLGAFTILSTAVFRELKGGDGANVSQHREKPGIARLTNYLNGIEGLKRAGRRGVFPLRRRIRARHGAPCVGL